MLAPDETFTNRGRPSSLLGRRVLESFMFVQSKWQRRVELCSPDSLARAHSRAWGLHCLHPVQVLLCMRRTARWTWTGFASATPQKTGRYVLYLWNIFIYFTPNPLFLPTYSLKLWACNILTCNRHWLMSNRSQNMFFVSMLLFWQHWPQVNIYICICKHAYIHISTCINSAIRTAFYSNHCPMLSTILITSDAEKRKNGNSALQITYWWPLVNDRQAKLQGTCYLELEFQANIFLHF